MIEQRMLDGIRAFVKEQRTALTTRSLWFEGKFIKVYLRAGDYHRDHANDEWLHAIGISNVACQIQKYEGKGYFKELVTFLEALGQEFGYDVIRVEEVHNEGLKRGLLKHGYEIDTTREDPLAIKKL